MDDRRFDALVRSLASGASRRAVLKGMLGLGGAAVASAAGLPDHAHAARRGFTGPRIPTPCVPNCDGTTCGSNGCGGTCSCDQGLLCIFDAGLCGRICPPCNSGCFCDEDYHVCMSNQSQGDCSGNFDCPAGTFCEERTSTCRAPCTSSVP
jgi:hypothetical protein